MQALFSFSLCFLSSPLLTGDCNSYRAISRSFGAFRMYFWQFINCHSVLILLSAGSGDGSVR